MAEITVFYRGPIVTRIEALAAGRRRYFTGKPCCHGHVAERYLRGNCVVCNRIWVARHVLTPAQLLAKRRDRRKYKINRKAKKRASGGLLKKKEIAALLDRQKGRCADPACPTPKKSIRTTYTVDHIEPLCPRDPGAAPGGNVISNIQLLCKSCNSRKHNKDPYEWALENGRLW